MVVIAKASWTSGATGGGGGGGRAFSLLAVVVNIYGALTMCRPVLVSLVVFTNSFSPLSKPVR